MHPEHISHEQIAYAQIRSSVPVGLRRAKKPFRRIHAGQGLLYFGIVMLLLLVFGGQVYALTGDYILESVAEQVFLLGSALLFVRLMRADRSEVFPLQKPKAAAVAGVLLLIFVSFLAAEAYSTLMLYLAPDALTEVSEGMDGLLQTPSAAMEFLVACVLPAACEEAVHRGVLTCSFRNTFRDPRISIALGGALFGVFHLYPIRMVMPAFIGCLMTWIVLQTGNMFYSCLLHLGYNGILILISRMAPEQDMTGVTSAGISAGVAGIALIFLGLFLPFLTYLGTWLIRRATAPRIPAFVPETHARRVFLGILIPTGVILLAGILLLTSRSGI